MKVVRIKAKGLRLAAGFGCSVGCDFEHEKLFQSIGAVRHNSLPDSRMRFVNS